MCQLVENTFYHPCLSQHVSICLCFTHFLRKSVRVCSSVLPECMCVLLCVCVRVCACVCVCACVARCMRVFCVVCVCVSR